MEVKVGEKETLDILQKQGMTETEARAALKGIRKGVKAYQEGKVRSWEEVKKELGIGDNPLVSVVFHFKDGAVLRQVFQKPIPQGMTMKALGKMVAELGAELNVDLGEEQLDVEVWAARSRKGEVCGVLGCRGKAVVKCKHCFNMYCEEHKFPSLKH